MNALADPDIIHYLYRASQVGIQIDLLIRGVCCLRPGVVGVSENIRVRSLVGRFLEHSRVYYFRNNGQEEIYLGSADMMQRNLNTRVEVLFPVEAQKLRTRLVEHMLLSLLKDTANAHELQLDGSYKRIRPPEGEEPFDCQDWFISHPLFNVDLDEDVSNVTASAIPSSA
jgi:polyphosphate kinase